MTSDSAVTPGSAVTPLEAVAERARALRDAGAGDPVGVAMVCTLLAHAEVLPEAGRARLVARAEALLATYQAQLEAPRVGARPDDTAWRAALDARVRARPPRVRTESRATELVAEIRATAATARAADHVPEAAGPYNGAAVASRALAELYALSPGYVGGYVAWLEELASLAELPERRAPRRKP